MELQAYFDELPEERREPMLQLWQVIADNIPSDFEARICYKMPSFVIPHSIYPAGYHGDPKLPLTFISLGSQKNYIVMHHMGLYASTDLLKWFTDEYSKRVKTKLDMGKGCVRFKKPEQIPFELIGELATRVSAQQYIDLYEKALSRR